MQEAKESAERGSRHKTQFLSAVSHDLRTPVNALSLQTELLSHVVAEPGGTIGGDLRELSADMRRAATGLVELINDLLDLTWYDSGVVRNHLADFALEEWLAATLGPLIPLAKAKGLDFRWRVDRPGRVVRADRVKLGRVLVNLVGNAIKFTESGRVDVSRVPCRGLAFPGRAPTPGRASPRGARADLRRVRPAPRTPSRPDQGTGLGLAICRRLVESVGGRLAVAAARSWQHVRRPYPPQPPPQSRGRARGQGRGRGVPPPPPPGPADDLAGRG